MINSREIRKRSIRTYEVPRKKLYSWFGKEGNYSKLTLHPKILIRKQINLDSWSDSCISPAVCCSSENLQIYKKKVKVNIWKSGCELSKLLIWYWTIPAVDWFTCVKLLLMSQFSVTWEEFEDTCFEFEWFCR